MKASFFPPPAAPLQAHLLHPWAPPCQPRSFLWLCDYKSGIHSNHSDLALLKKQTEATWAFDSHSFTFFPGQGSEGARAGTASQAQHQAALIYRCSVFLPLNLPAFSSLKL